MDAIDYLVLVAILGMMAIATAFIFLLKKKEEKSTTTPPPKRPASPKPKLPEKKELLPDPQIITDLVTEPLVGNSDEKTEIAPPQKVHPEPPQTAVFTEEILEANPPPLDFFPEFQELLRKVYSSPGIWIRYFPLMIPDTENQTLHLDFPFAQKNPDIERIYAAWKRGYQDTHLWKILLPYFLFTYVNYRENFVRLMEVWSIRQIPVSFRCYFQNLLPDIFGFSPENRISAPMQALEDYSEGTIPEKELAMVRIFARIQEKNRISDKDFLEIIHEAQKTFPETSASSFLSFLAEPLRYLGTPAAKIRFHRLGGTSLFSRDFMIRQIFFYGNHHKIHYLHPPVGIFHLARFTFLKESQRKIFLKWSHNHFQQLILRIPYFSLHFFYAQAKRNKHKEVDEMVVQDVERQFKLSPLHPSEEYRNIIPKTPPRILKMLLVFLNARERHMEFLVARKVLPEHFVDYAVHILTARSIFFMKKYNFAIAYLKKHIPDFDKDLAVMNELAIYYYYSGDLEKSGEIFQYLQETFRENLTVAYNKNLFNDRKYTLESFLAWKSLREKMKTIR